MTVQLRPLRSTINRRAGCESVLLAHQGNRAQTGARTTLLHLATDERCLIRRPLHRGEQEGNHVTRFDRRSAAATAHAMYTGACSPAAQTKKGGGLAEMSIYFDSA